MLRIIVKPTSALYSLVLWEKKIDFKEFQS